jgi:hypothetical protein
MFKIWDAASANWKLTGSFVATSVWAFITASLLWAWWDGIATLSALVGVALGWSAGILLAPYDDEEKRFQKLSKSIAGFISGYLVAKSDRVFDLVTDKSAGGPLILDPYFARVIWMGVGCMAMAGLTVFVARTYSQPVNSTTR